MIGTQSPETRREKKKKHTKKNCAPSWLYLQDYTGVHGQHNIKLGPKWIEWDGVDWIYVSHDKHQSRRVVNTVTKRRII
jgi:hypothetical protein